MWEERPLPVAFFTHGGSTARDHAVKALNRRKIPYRMSYEASHLGLLSMVEAGRGRALARCCIPDHLVQLSESHGLPPLGEMEVVLARSAVRAPAVRLAEQILGEWRT